jgi:hypothetical protein
MRVMRLHDNILLKYTSIDAFPSFSSEKVLINWGKKLIHKSNFHKSSDSGLKYNGRIDHCAMNDKQLLDSLIDKTTNSN